MDEAPPRARRYDAVLRISTNAGDILDDSIRLPRGLALKVLGVEGERLPGSEGDTTQDFILVNGPTFGNTNTKKFLANLKTDKFVSIGDADYNVVREAEAAKDAGK